MPRERAGRLYSKQLHVTYNSTHLLKSDGVFSEEARSKIEAFQIAHEYCPSTGRPHTHVSIRFKSRINRTVASWKKLLAGKAGPLTPRAEAGDGSSPEWDGSPIIGGGGDEAGGRLVDPSDIQHRPGKVGWRNMVEYGKKADQRPFQFGRPSLFNGAPGAGAGARIDWGLARDRISDAASWRAVLMDPDITGIVARHMKWAKEFYDVSHPQIWKPPSMTLTPWQALLARWILLCPAEHRQLHWVWSAASGTGKTTFANWLTQHCNVLPLSRKISDDLHMLSPETRVVWMDLPNSAVVEEKVRQLVEHWSNHGWKTSGKYQGTRKAWSGTLLVTSNQGPEALGSHLLQRVVEWGLVQRLTGTSMTAMRSTDAQNLGAEITLHAREGIPSLQVPGGPSFAVNVPGDLADRKSVV